MKKKLILVVALAALLSVVLSSCSLMDIVISADPSPKREETDKKGEYLTKEDLDAILADYEKTGGAPVINGGDTYEITIDGSKTDFDILAASRALLSSVSVYCSFERQSRYSTSTYSTAGSGVIYKLDKEKGDAYILTNYHVVFDASSNTANHVSDNIRLYLYGQEAAAYAIGATYVGGSMNYDLALLKVTGSNVLRESNAIEATFADSNDVVVLETAIAIGNPEAEGISATVGHINVDSEYIKMTGADNRTEVELRVMRVDAAVNSGNSGGGLYNSNGELIGIVNAKMSDTSVDNIGYAIPSNIAKYIAENILYYCDGTDKENVYRCMLGISVAAKEYSTKYDVETGKIHRIETVSVEEVSDGKPAAGKLELGDLIRSVTIDGTKYDVLRMYNVIDSMLNARVGSTVVFEVEREGETVNVTIEITESALTAAG